MSILDWKLYGNTLQSWSLALLIVTVSVTGLVVLKSKILSRFGPMVGRSPNRFDDGALEAVRATKHFFLLAISLYLGIGGVSVPDSIERLLRHMFIVASLVQAGIWGSTLIGFVVARYAAAKLEEDGASAMTLRFLGLGGRFALWVLLLLVGLDNLGVDITALVAGLGVGGIAVALAVQNILGDLFASLSIVLDKPFVIGDFILVDELMGTVETIGVKTTRLRSLSGEQLIFSNADLLASRIRNFKRMAERRVVFGVGVPYDTPFDKIESIPSILRDAVETQEKIRFDRAHFKGFGASSLDFEVAYYVLEPDYNVYMDVQQAINLRVLSSFLSEQIAFAFPTQTLYVEKLGSNDHFRGQAVPKPEATSPAEKEALVKGGREPLV